MGNIFTSPCKKKYSSIIMERIWKSQNPSEQIELISDDDKRIPIHRVILAATSKYFAASLGPNSKEGDRKESRLEGSNGETLRMIIDYCYTGRIKLTGKNVQTYLKIASRYQFDLLGEKCCTFFAETLSVTNSVEALMTAEKFDYAKLRQAALDLICEYFERVPSAEVQKLDHQLFQKILESDQIKASQELIFDRLLKWSQHKGEERDPHVPNLLKLIQLQNIKLETLKDTVSPFYEQFNCAELILAEYRRRTLDNHFDSDLRRCLFCLFTKYEEENGSEYSVIKVGRFERESRNWKEIEEFPLGKRMCFSVVLNQNKIYALGGILDGVYCNTVSAFDLNSRQEELLPNMNISRKDCTSIVFGEHIYVFGGYNVSGQLCSCERFDIERKRWTEIKPMSKARSFVSAVVMNGCIYIAGGRDGGVWWRGPKATKTFESYDPMRNAWKELAPMKAPRSSFALIQSNGFIYAIGGGKEIIEKYDATKNGWTEISHSHLDDSDSITSGININGEIYVMMANGTLRRIKIDESDNCSFFKWVVETAYKTSWQGSHFFTLN